MNNEPVAWMYRIKDTDNRWELTWNKPTTEELFDTEPLYTQPHPDNLGLAESIIKQQQLEIEALKDEVAEWKMSYENCHRMCSGYGMN
jgi:hypothetical protein